MLDHMCMRIASLENCVCHKLLQLHATIEAIEMPDQSTVAPAICSPLSTSAVQAPVMPHHNIW